MKGLFRKLMVVASGVVALFGLSAANVTPSTSDISGKSPLYLVHGNQISSGVLDAGQHVSHGSHESHASHVSHGSGY